MTFFDPLKPDRPEFDAIETDEAKTLVWSPPPAGYEDFIFPPAPPHGPKSGTKVASLPPAGASLDELLMRADRNDDEKKAHWWRRLWPSR